MSNKKQYIMHYNAPAQNWNEALPLGNGRIGAMVFGHLEEERYQINEDSFWSGFPRDTNNYEAIRYLQEARSLIERHKYAEAEQLIQNKMLSVNPQAYQPFADLWMRLHASETEPIAYKRSLHLNEGISYSVAEFSDHKIMKEAWISEPHQVLVIHLHTNSKQQLDIELGFTSPHAFKRLTSEYFSASLNAPAHIADNYHNNHPLSVQYEKDKGIRGNCTIRAVSNGNIAYAENAILVQAATEVTFYVAMNTSFINFETLPHQDDSLLLKQNLQTLQLVSKFSYEQLKHNHIQNFKSYFERVDFSLQTSKAASQAVMDYSVEELLKEYKEGRQHLELEELYFHYGKYLLISASRASSEAMNLQGIWNEHVQPPWFSAYTLNINTEMNYWPVLALDLPECVEPLYRFIQELKVTGSRTARIHYNARGWTAHHNSDIWRMSTPTAGSPSWSFWPMASIWLCQHLWEHYLYEQDIHFLNSVAYPIMKEAALFAIDWLVEGDDGLLTTSPSTSPENLFAYEGEVSSVAQGSAMDLTLIRELFEHCLSAAELLAHDDLLFLDEVKHCLSRLAQVKLAADGSILEWTQHFDEVEKGHRHVSHLYGIYPGHSYLEGDLAYINGAKQTLENRIAHGGGHTGWSCAWLINLFARLKDGERAHHYVQTLLSRSTYNNLFDAHPPFQIDGNFGGIAGMLEMVVQSHLDKICLLPALPSTWQSGSISGVKLRGGFSIAMCWHEGRLDYADITSNKGAILKLSDAHLYWMEELDTGLAYPADHQHETKINQRYRITLKRGGMR